MKTNKWVWAVLCALAFTTLTGCVVDPDHRGGGPEYYGHDGDHWDHHYDHDHGYYRGGPLPP